MTGRRVLATVLLASGPLGAAVQPAPAVPEAAVLQIEIAAARDLLRGHAGYRVIVDARFAEPEQAPPALTKELRTAARTAALADSLARGRPVHGATAIVRLSRPRLRGDTADVSATVDFPSAHAPGRRGYETVRYRLERGPGGWRVRQRTQLGIS